ncbi:hypothetical protein Tco_0542919 [Tanacetum coccineum]
MLITLFLSMIRFFFEVEPDQGGLTSVDMDEISYNSTNGPLLELPEFESFHFDPSFPRPPSEPPDVEICLNFEPDADVINNFDELDKDECFDPRRGVKTPFLTPDLLVDCLVAGPLLPGWISVALMKVRLRFSLPFASQWTT